MSERDFEVNGKKFKLGKIDPIKQFHIVRRMGPVMSEILPAAMDFNRAQKTLNMEDQDAVFGEAAKVFAPVMVGLSKLSDADADRVLYGLLASVEVQQSTGNWARVANDSMIMMQDLELPVLMQIAGRAFMFNLSGFTSGGVQTDREVNWVSMPDDEDWLYRPVAEGLCKYESLKDGTLDLLDIAKMNDLLDVKYENEARYRKANEK